MAIEHAYARPVHKPWGSTDLWPWSGIQHGPATIGELWFHRSDEQAPEPALLFKLLFTKEPLSIQVHPDDAFAKAAGLGRGKSEAWYILSATPDAQVAVGLKRSLTAAQLRASIEDGLITELVHWRQVAKGDSIFVPAGTIHAIGAGLVIAEVQQRSDATFRLFDHGRQRTLHIEHAVAAATAGPAERPVDARCLTDSRTLLVASPPFVLERLEFEPQSNWKLNVPREAWVLVLDGHASVESINAFVGEVIFVEADSANIKVGSDGLVALVAYTGPDSDPQLLQAQDGQTADRGLGDFSQPFPHRAVAEPSRSRPAEKRS